MGGGSANEFIAVGANGTIIRGARPVASITVTPASPTLTAIDDVVQLSASALDALGNPITRKNFTWNSGNPSVATVDAAGLVTAVADGSATLPATAPCVSAHTSLPVAPPASPGAPAHRARGAKRRRRQWR